MITCQINGTTYPLLWDFYLDEKSGNKTSSRIQLDCTGIPIPNAGDIVEVFNDSDRVFWGKCGIPRSPKYTTGLEKCIYTIDCGDGNSILANRVVNEAYTNLTVSQIVTNLYNGYISTEGVSLGEISPIDIKVKVYSAADQNLQDCLNELADLVNAVWRVDANKVFSFVVKDDFPVFPQKIGSGFGKVAQLQHTTKDYKTRTVQIISGAMSRTSTQTETSTYTDGAYLTTAFPIAEQPSIYINGTQVPPEDIGVAGIQNGRAFLWSYNSQTITYDLASGYLNEDDSVEIQYIGLFPVRVQVENPGKISEVASLTGTSGRIERVSIVNEITDYNDAFQTAASMLSQFSESQGILTFWTTSEALANDGYTLSDLDLLTQISVDLPQLSIVGDFVITERRLERWNEDGTQLKITITATNRDYLKSYGEIFSSLQKSINALSFRADTVAVQSQTVTDTIRFTDELIQQVAFGRCPGWDGVVVMPLGEDIYFYEA